MIPVELVETILRLVTVDSYWPDDVWRLIRRVVMDRDTLGWISSDTQFFDAYELLYLCRTCNK